MTKSKYQILSKLFKILGNIYLFLLGIVMIISIIGFLLAAPNFISGWNKVMEVFSPFNIANFIVTVISISPAILFYKLHDYFKEKST